MTLETVNGCICDSITIDGIETIDLPIDKVKDTIKTLINKETWDVLNFIISVFTRTAIVFDKIF